MRVALLLLFIAVPLLELVVLIKVGQLIGLWPTVLIVVVTAIAGTAILHRQGLAALSRAFASVEHGELPIEPVTDGVMLLLAGALLLTPGLITDAAGLLLLVPMFRRRMASWVFDRLIQRGRSFLRRQRNQLDEHEDDGVVIEGEFERIEDAPPKAKPRDRRG
ncbi:MAG TPA: FxsA family protein [Hyphomicrobiaceae bacterium]|nr:FxsA family protein [Hyphomicrobiaceae bacterium]